MPESPPAKSPRAKDKVKNLVVTKLGSWKARIAREISGGQTSGTSEGNHVELYFDGDRAFTSMIEAISSAHHFVHLEMYMFFSDQTGSKFADALSAKAREGIPVRVLYDAIGSMEADPMQWARMRDAGVTVIEYRPISFWRKRSGLIGRNHRKNLIIDGSIAFTGGMNIGDAWSIEVSSDASWRDTQCRVIGPAARDLNKLFIDSWQYATDETLHLDTEYESTNQAQSLSTGSSRCIVVGSQGLRTSSEIRKLFSVNLARAKHSICMTMPYFVPPRRLRKALQQAKKRGINVELLLPRDSDVKFVDWLREGLYPQMLKWGVTIREYLGPILHAKTMVVDNQIAVIGSSNFDILSVLMNREVGLVIFDEKVSAELHTQWQNDLMLSERVTRDWEGIRPWWRLLIAKIGCFLLRRL